MSANSIAVEIFREIWYNVEKLLEDALNELNQFVQWLRRFGLGL